MAPQPTVIDLTWTGELAFAVTAGTSSYALDSAGQLGPSPVQALASAIAGCMGIDLVHILTKGRHDLTGLTAHLVAHRADTEPRRLVKVELHYRVQGDVPDTAIERAIELSRDKYCSVWQSIRQDTEFIVTFEVAKA